MALCLPNVHAASHVHRRHVGIDSRRDQNIPFLYSLQNCSPSVRIALSPRQRPQTQNRILQRVDDKNALTVLAFFCIVAFFTAFGIIMLVLDGVDPETSFGLIACMMNNVGIAFRAAGPTDSFAFLSNYSKIFPQAGCC